MTRRTWATEKIGTYNLKWNVGRWLAERAILRMTRHASAFGLQECRTKSRHRALRALLLHGWHYWQPDGPDQAAAVPICWDGKVWKLRDKGSERVARSRIVEGRRKGHFKRFPERHLVWVELEHRATGQGVTLADTHWMPHVDQGGRVRRNVAHRLVHYREQTWNVLEWARGRENVIVLGDTNVTPKHPLLDPFRDARFKVAFQEFPSPVGSHGALRSKREPIDQFIYRLTSGTVRAVAACVLLWRRPSDHRPTVLSIQLETRETP